MNGASNTESTMFASDSSEAELVARTPSAPSLRRATRANPRKRSRRATSRMMSSAIWNPNVSFTSSNPSTPTSTSAAASPAARDDSISFRNATRLGRPVIGSWKVSSTTRRFVSRRWPTPHATRANTQAATTPPTIAEKSSLYPTIWNSSALTGIVRTALITPARAPRIHAASATGSKIKAAVAFPATP